MALGGVVSRRLGRPPKVGARRTSGISVRCTPEEREAWNAAAEADGEEVGEVVRRLLTAWAAAVLGEDS